MLYPLFSYYRRLLIVISVILLPDNFIAQYFILTMSTFGMIVLIGYKKPFTLTKQNRAALFNEVYIIFFMYQIFCLTEFVPDESTRTGVGYSAITFVLLHLLYNYIMLTYSAVRGLIRSCRRR